MKHPFNKISPKPRDRHGPEPEDNGDAFHVSVVEGKVKVASEEDPEKEIEIDVKLVNIFVFGPIEEPDQFIPAIEALQFLKETDHVVVHISSPGGDIGATDTFLNALDNCAAGNTFIATGGCHSAATIMLMHAEEIQFSENFYSLVHNGSMGYGGKASDFRSAADFYRKWDETVMWRTYKGFLTNEELEGVIRGVDIWMDGAEFQARLQKRNELENQDEE